MTPLVATDLDRTLIYSPRSAGVVDPATVQCVEQRHGVPVSTVTRAAAAALAELDRASTWVPTTTRTVAEYLRVRLPGHRDARPRHAVCANGGVLLVDGVVDHRWATHVRHLVAGAAALDEVASGLERRVADLPDRVTGPVRRADGLFLCIVVDPERRPDGWVEEVAAFCTGRGWRACVQGDKVYALPAELTKTAAVEEILRRAPAERVLAAGDSLLDADLLLRADAGIRPAHGELHTTGWGADHVTVTSTTGIRAGEDIARWLLARVRA